MSPSDTTSINPRDDGTNKAGRMDDDTGKPYRLNDPKPDPETSPGPDTREEPNSPK